MYGPKSNRVVTSTDVATAAGVSRATVSFVLNDKPGTRISPETRERVMEVARRLGYTPNEQARSLAGAPVQSGVVVCAPTQSYGDGADELLRRMAGPQPSNEDGILLSVADVSPVELARRIARLRPAAVFVESTRFDAEATEVLRGSRVRSLICYGVEEVAYAPSLVFPQAEFGARAAQSLVASGHRRVALVGPPPSSIGHPASLRLEAAASVLAAAGVRVDRVESSTDPGSLRDWARGMRYDRDPAGAVIAPSLDYALAVDAALRAVGEPDDPSITIVCADIARAPSNRIPTFSFSIETAVTSLTGSVAALQRGEFVHRIELPPLVAPSALRQIDARTPSGAGARRPISPASTRR